MSYGLSLTGPDGTLLIKEGEMVPTFHAKYTIAEAKNGGKYSWINTGIPATEKFALLFGRGDVLLYNQIARDTPRGMLKKDGYWQICHGGGNGELYVFRAPTNNQSQGKYGVQILNSDGSVAFQNTSPPIRLLGFAVTNKQAFSQKIAIQRVTSRLRGGADASAATGTSMYGESWFATDAALAKTYKVAENTVVNGVDEALYLKDSYFPTLVRKGPIAIIDVTGL